MPTSLTYDLFTALSLSFRAMKSLSVSVNNDAATTQKFHHSQLQVDSQPHGWCICDAPTNQQTKRTQKKRTTPLPMTKLPVTYVHSQVLRVPVIVHMHCNNLTPKLTSTLVHDTHDHVGVLANDRRCTRYSVVPLRSTRRFFIDVIKFLIFVFQNSTEF